MRSSQRSPWGCSLDRQVVTSFCKRHGNMERISRIVCHIDHLQPLPIIPHNIEHELQLATSHFSCHPFLKISRLKELGFPTATLFPSQSKSNYPIQARIIPMFSYHFPLESLFRKDRNPKRLLKRIVISYSKKQRCGPVMPPAVPQTTME